MYNRSNVGSLLINAHMHFNLGRGTEALVCLNHISLCVNLTDKFRGHKALGHACRCAEKFIVAQLDGDISIVCRNHVAVVDSFADVANLFFDFILVQCHFFLLFFYALYHFYDLLNSRDRNLLDYSRGLLP